MVETACVGLYGGGAAFTDTPLNDLLKDEVKTCTCEREFTTASELKKHITEVVNGDRCEKCHHLLTDDELEGAYESRGEYHGTQVSEYIIHSYKCKECGNDEVF